MDRVLTYDFVTSLVNEVNSVLRRPESAGQITQLQGRIHAFDRAITRLVDVAEKVGDTAEVVSRLKQRKDERERLRQEPRLVESSQEAIEVPRQIMEEILAEMRERLAEGKLDAQRAVLKSTVDHIVVEQNRAELYYQFPCANLYKVPPARLERAHTASEAAALSA